MATASAGSEDLFGSIRLSIDAQNAHGCTLLMKAAAAGQLSLMQWFVRVGAVVTTASVQGRTALHFAAESGWVEAVMFLCEHGAEPGAADAAGLTPAALASTNNHIECVQYLWQRHNLVSSARATTVDTVGTIDSPVVDDGATTLCRESKRARTARAAARTGSGSPTTADEPADDQTDGPDGYTLRFVARRLEAGATAEDVLAEFRVPRSRWPVSAPDQPGTVERLRDAVVQWFRHHF